MLLFTFFIFRGFLNLSLWIIIDYLKLFQSLHYFLLPFTYCIHNFTWNQLFVCWDDCRVKIKVFWSFWLLRQGIQKMRYFLNLNFTKLPMTFCLFRNIHNEFLLIVLNLFLTLSQIKIQKLYIIVHFKKSFARILMKIFKLI